MGEILCSIIWQDISCVRLGNTAGLTAKVKPIQNEWIQKFKHRILTLAKQSLDVNWVNDLGPICIGFSLVLLFGMLLPILSG